MAGERQLPGLGLYGFWNLGSSGWKGQMDENMLALSALVQASVLESVASLPGSPTDGNRYLLTSGVDANKIAVRDNGAWVYLVPSAGWLVYDIDAATFKAFDGSSWAALVTGGTGSWLTGSTVPGSGLGADGDFYLRSNGDVYQKAAGAWGAVLFSLLGPPGANGTDGTNGTDGVDGVDGADGRSVLNGSGAPSGATGADGDFYINTAAWEIHGPKAAGSWPSGVSMTGSSGPVAWEMLVAASDETTALTVGTAKTTFRMPRSVTLTEVRASVTTAPTGGTLLTVDINKNGASILSTKLTFDASEKTTTTATTPAVISDSSLTDDAEITIDIDAVGSTVAGAGLKVLLKGTIA